MIELVALDIGGTNARLARASIAADGVISLERPVVLRTSDFVGLRSAWEAYRAQAGTLPPRAAIAIAGPVGGEVVRMTNNNWEIRPAEIAAELGLEAVTVINDFGAVAHTVARVPSDQFEHLAGPDAALPASGTISVIGPGTGLGVAHFARFGGTYRVQPTEGAHVDFAPVDAIDDLILARLRKKHRRVSLERVVSGPGIEEIYLGLAAYERRELAPLDDRTIWQRGLANEDALCSAAVDRFCGSLGSVAGDYALAHGASAVVIAGGLGFRLRERLRHSTFAERFRLKGRYEAMMAGIPVKLIVHPQPGLFGAAAAFASEHLEEIT